MMRRNQGHKKKIECSPWKRHLIKGKTDMTGGEEGWGGSGGFYGEKLSSGDEKGNW